MRIHALAVILSVIFVGTASAQGGGMMGGQGMMQGQGGGGMMGQYGYLGIDRNGDGLLTKDEVRDQLQLLDRLQDNWEEADRNRDGQIDTTEFSAFEQSLQQ